MYVYLVYDYQDIDKIFLDKEKADKYVSLCGGHVEEREISEDLDPVLNKQTYIRSAIEWNDKEDKYTFTIQYDCDVTDKERIFFWKNGYGRCRVSYYTKVKSKIVDFDELENKNKALLVEMKNVAKEAMNDNKNVVEIEKILRKKFNKEV